MRVIATFILLGVLCHCGLCNGVEPTNATASTALAPTGVSGSAPTATAPAATATAAAVTTPAATATTGDNSEATPTSRATAPVGTTPASKTTTANETTPPNETTTTNETTPPNVTAPPNETTPTTGTTTTVAVTVSPEATTSKQPQELPTVMSASTASTPTATSPSTRTAATETTTALPTVVPTSTANATHNPAGVPPIPQSQSPSSAATTVTVSQDAPGPGREVTTGNGTGILPKTTNAPVKGGGGEKTVVYVKGRTDDQGKPDFKVCEELMKAVQADKCTLTTSPDGTIKSGFVQVNVTVLKELQEKHRHKEKDPPKNTTLIAILCSCAALLAMTAAFIAYTTCHRRSYRKNQQHLTEELQTVENGYHDNPTLEVMEVQPEMQEKKTALNGEFNDSWIVPYDPQAKDDMPDEEDTHL